MKHWILGLAAMAFMAGCNTAEEKAIVEERVELVKMEIAVLDSTKTCNGVQTGMAKFEKDNKARIDSFNTSWKALSESKRNSLMKPHRAETDPYYKKIIVALVDCGTHFPVS